jgi:HlyD family secretion protein
MNPTTVQNVVTYDAIIDFANPELKLFPGMTAYVTIPVATAEDVVKIPNAALRYKPPLSAEAVLALYAKYGLAEAAQAADPAASGGGGAAAPGGRGAAAAPAGGPGGRRAARGDSAVVWKLRADGTLEPVKVGLGITDHTYTEVTRLIVGAVKAGDELVTSSVSSKTLPPGAPGIRR